MFYLPTWLIIILAIAAGIGMAVCAKKKEDPKFKPFAVICALVLLVCAYSYIDNEIGIGRDNLDTRIQQASANRLQEAKIKTFCEYIKAKNPGKIVIVAPGGKDYAKNEYTMKQIDLVKQYLGSGDVKALDYVVNENEPAPMEVKVADWNKFFKANTDANLFVILEQLPMNPDEILRLDAFSSGKQKVALMDMGDVVALKPFFKRGTIMVSVTGKSGLKQEDYEKPAPEDLKEAFDARYIIVDQKNIDSIK